MRGIKIPQYEFALKMQGGLMREGGRICGTLRYMKASETEWSYQRQRIQLATRSLCQDVHGNEEWGKYNFSVVV